MGVHVIRRGLDLPIDGAPASTIDAGAAVSRVAVVAADYPFMKPRMAVSVGDTVTRGQLLFDDRKSEGVRFTAPGAGTVVAIHRGDRRALRSVVIELSAGEKAGRPADGENPKFSSFTGKHPRDLTAEQVRALLAESGLWTALRQRPFGRVPPTTETPRSIFVNAMDSNPLAADPAVVLKGQEEDLKRGLHAVAKLTDGKVWFVRAAGAAIEPGDAPRVQVEEFRGKHPAGLVGTHIHMLDPVGRERTVWHLDYQDVAAIGRLFAGGTLPVERVIALGGPNAKRPRLLRTRLGAELGTLVAGELTDGEIRVISGSVLHGRAAQDDVEGFLGRYHLQVSALREGRERVFLGWLRPGMDKFSVVRAFTAGLMGKKRGFPFSTTTHGSLRAMVPIGMFEKVMPLDILPTFLLRALAVDDLDRAEALGALELDEEDLALCCFVDPCKEDHAAALRRNLTTIWKEG
ncbi:MAG: Na(+)-translocating NADH-quinone reductase subunit A [bacterium]